MEHGEIKKQAADEKEKIQNGLLTEKEQPKQSHSCEDCGAEMTDTEAKYSDYCDSCYEQHYCECGRELEEKGQGLCRRCD